VRPTIGDRIAVGDGYDLAPLWLSGRPAVTGRVTRWIAGPNTEPACLVHLDEPLTATWLVDGRRESRTGSYLVLELRHQGLSWQASGAVRVELCETDPGESGAERQVGPCIESHATYLITASDLATPGRHERTEPTVAPSA
jgi:hypothetical protein